MNAILQIAMIVSILIFVATVLPAINFYYHIFMGIQFESERSCRIVLLFTIINHISLTYFLYWFVYISKAFHNGTSFIPALLVCHLMLFDVLFFLGVILFALEYQLRLITHRISSPRLLSSYFKFCFKYSDFLKRGKLTHLDYYDIGFLRILLIAAYLLAGIMVSSNLANYVTLYIKLKDASQASMMQNVWNRDLQIYSEFFLTTVLTIVVGNIASRVKK